MSLEDEIVIASKRVVKDGYDMSVGELISLYVANELSINPKYQRYFRWDISQKTKFIESLLLGIPIPPIFVFTAGRKWELIDGLQRLSTILEFVGILRDALDPTGRTCVAPSLLEGTHLLPSLESKCWESEDGANCLSEEQRFSLKRVRIRVEILKKESDPLAKFELFQRLNGGGSTLSEQELRSCVIVMLNEPFFDWVSRLASEETFLETVSPTDRAAQRQQPLEWAIRYFSYLHSPYNGLDVHDYLDTASLSMATDKDFDQAKQEFIFRALFSLLSKAFGVNAFRNWEGGTPSGQVSLSAFECITHGIAVNIGNIQKLGEAAAVTWVKDKIIALWSSYSFRTNSQAGVRGTTRLTQLLPFSEKFFSP